MLKRILLLADETPSSVSAQTFAITLAGRFNAELTALSGVNETHAQRAEPVPPGGSAWSQHRAEREVADARARCERLRAAIGKACGAKGVTLHWLQFDGDPIAAVSDAAQTHDLIVTGHDTAFLGTAESGLADTPLKLLQATPRPVLVLPDAVPDGSGVLVAYDGSAPAVRSLQLATLLGLLNKQPPRLLGLLGKPSARILSVGERAAVSAEHAASYLGVHGVEAKLMILADKGTVGDQMIAAIASEKPYLVVMGAYGHRGWRELLFGTTTRQIVDACPAPLFLYH